MTQRFSTNTDRWIEENWIFVNAGGVVTPQQYAELKNYAMIDMLNGRLDWNDGCSIRQFCDTKIEELNGARHGTSST